MTILQSLQEQGVFDALARRKEDRKARKEAKVNAERRALARDLASELKPAIDHLETAIKKSRTHTH